MKPIVAALSLLSLAASAVEPAAAVGTFDDWGQTVRGLRYLVDPSRGEVRVVIEFQLDSPDGDGRTQVTRAVSALRYDASRRAVVLDANGSQTVCGTVERELPGGASRNPVEDTGRCHLVATRRRIASDDGFEHHERLVQDLALITH